jgi:two-component system chemotaxis response regulator CheB
VIAVAISTGGVQTIEAVLTRLPRTVPGMVVVQHMPPNFTASLAARLNGLCELEVLEAKDGDRVINGRVLFAPGGRHMRLRRSGAQYVVEVFDGPLVNHHRPNADVLFKSVSQCAGRNAIGVVMTGMGDDGARGLREMFNAGAKTAAQDEASCVVYGMPKEAVKHGGVQQVVSLEDMPNWLMSAARSPVAQA